MIQNGLKAIPCNPKKKKKKSCLWDFYEKRDLPYNFIFISRHMRISLDPSNLSKPFLYFLPWTCLNPPQWRKINKRACRKEKKKIVWPAKNLGTECIVRGLWIGLRNGYLFSDPHPVHFWFELESACFPSRTGTTTLIEWSLFQVGTGVNGAYSSSGPGWIPVQYFFFPH